MKKALVHSVYKRYFLALHPLGIAHLALFGICASVLLASCGRTTVQPGGGYTAGEQLPKPTRILVATFSVSPEDVSLDSAIGSRLQRLAKGKPQSEEQMKVGTAVAEVLAESLVKDLRNQGLPAERASTDFQPSAQELLIAGHLLSVQEGNRARRVIIGFGAGGSELKALVQIYQGTGTGRILVREFEASAKSSRKPGMGPLAGAGAAAGSAATSAAMSGGLGLAVETRQTVEGNANRMAKEIAKQLSEFFRSQGWI